MLTFDRYTVKHGRLTQNIQNEGHQWLSGSFKVHQIRFRPRLCPGPHWGAYSASPDPLAGLRGPTFKWRGTREREKAVKRGRGREREGPPPFANSWIRHWQFTVKTLLYDVNNTTLIHFINGQVSKKVRSKMIFCRLKIEESRTFVSAKTACILAGTWSYWF